MIGVIFVIWFVPETKGRDLDSIAKLFLKPDDTHSIIKSKDNGNPDKSVGKSQVKCDVEISNF